MCSVLGSDYGNAVLGTGGEFLLQLDEGIDEDSLQQALAFDLETEEASEHLPLQSYLDQTGREGPINLALSP